MKIIWNESKIIDSNIKEYKFIDIFLKVFEKDYGMPIIREWLDLLKLYSLL